MDLVQDRIYEYIIIMRYIGANICKLYFETRRKKNIINTSVNYNIISRIKHSYIGTYYILNWNGMIAAESFCYTRGNILQITRCIRHKLAPIGSI